MRRITFKRNGLWYFVSLCKHSDGNRFKVINISENKYMEEDGGLDKVKSIIYKNQDRVIKRALS